MTVYIKFEDNSGSGAKMNLTSKQFEDLLNKKLSKKDSDDIYEMYMLVKMCEEAVTKQ